MTLESKGNQRNIKNCYKLSIHPADKVCEAHDDRARKKSKERSYRSYGPSEQKVPVYLFTHKV